MGAALSPLTTSFLWRPCWLWEWACAPSETDLFLSSDPLKPGLRGLSSQPAHRLASVQLSLLPVFAELLRALVIGQASKSERPGSLRGYTMGVEKEGQGTWWEAASKHGAVSEKGVGKGTAG